MSNKPQAKDQRDPKAQPANKPQQQQPLQHQPSKPAAPKKTGKW